MEVEADLDATKCPAFAHIRKVNPRDLATDQGDEVSTLSFQMLRRGITWGTPYSEEEPHDAGDRGLLFMSYQVSIVDQFEELTQRWMNQTGAPEGLAGHDLLVGQAGDGPRTATIGPTPFTVPAAERWVTPTGGGYFFTPSTSALRRFAGDEYT